MNALIQSINQDNFDTQVLQTSLPTVVDFWAEWCAPCRAQNPILEELAGEWQGKVNIAKINVDDQPALAQRYNIMSIPTMIIFNSGEAVKQLVGVQSKEQLRAHLAALKITSGGEL